MTPASAALFVTFVNRCGEPWSTVTRTAPRTRFVASPVSVQTRRGHNGRVMRAPLWLASALLLFACDETAATDAGPDANVDAAAPDGGSPEPLFVAVTFNTGTTESLPHDSLPDDGYTQDDATVSDTWYGDGLAWLPAVEATRAWFAAVDADVAAFQEIFHAPACAEIPPEHHAGFYCETWREGEPTVANAILPMGFQVACHLGKPDKCAAVHRRFGTFRGCDGDLCLDGLDGAPVPDCGRGSRVGRGVIDLVDGGSITLVTIHATSGVTAEDQACRLAQVEQIFVDLDGEPAANGAVNVILGDFNTDPARLAGGDPSAARLWDLVEEGDRFHFVSAVGRRVTPTYADLFNIDHVISDRLDGTCWAAGITEGRPPVLDAVYFDHVPIVCPLRGDLP